MCRCRRTCSTASVVILTATRGDAPQSPSVSPEERLLAAEERPRRRRGVLLGTAACVLVLGAGAAYFFSSYNTGLSRATYGLDAAASGGRSRDRTAGSRTIGALGARQCPALAGCGHAGSLHTGPQKVGSRGDPRPQGWRSECSAGIRPLALPRRLFLTLMWTAPFRHICRGEPGGPAISSNPATIATQQPAITAAAPEIVPPAAASKPDLTRSIVAGMRDHDAALQAAASGVQAASPEAAQPVTPPAPGQHRLALAYARAAAG